MPVSRGSNGCVYHVQLCVRPVYGAPATDARLLFLAEGGAGAKQKMNPETSPGPWSDSPDTSNPPSLLATFGKAQFCRGSAPLGGSLPQAPYASRQPRRVVRPHNAIVAKGCTARPVSKGSHGARQPLCAHPRRLRRRPARRFGKNAGRRPLAAEDVRVLVADAAKFCFIGDVHANAAAAHDRRAPFQQDGTERSGPTG